jgi:uncharacterized protein (DUF927 family)
MEELLTAQTGARGRHNASEILRSDPAEIQRGLRLLCQPGAVYELRALQTRRGAIASGYYTELTKFAQDAATCTDRLHAVGTYFTINPTKAELLSRASNHLREYVKKDTTADTDVVRRCWLPLDFDSVRPSGISATDEEHAAALAKAHEARDFLHQHGWPPPIVIDSGNGSYLLYPVDLANDDLSRELFKRVLEALNMLLSDGQVCIDRTMFNAARIIRVPGTLNRKGDNLADRPHRLARILETPEQLQIVSREQLREIASLLPEPETRQLNRDRRSDRFDLNSFIAHHGIAVKGINPYHGGRRIVLEHCLFDSAHGGTSAAIIELGNGALQYCCRHNSCADKHWADLRKKYEPNYRERRTEQGDHVREQFGSDANQARTAARSTATTVNNAGDGIAWGFELRQNGVFRAKAEGEEVEWIRVCSPLWVDALVRNGSEAWGRLLRFADLDHNVHEWAMPMDLLAGDGLELRQRLLQMGLTIESGRFARESLISYISGCCPTARATSVPRVGWHDNSVFVLPHCVIGDHADGERVVFQTAFPADYDTFGRAGTLADWREHIGERCAGNSRLILAVSAALAGPLLHVIKEESGGIHLVGPSSIGKTTALRVAGSVIGGGGLRGFVRQWRATANGLEAIAAAHCDLTLLLDELSQVSSKDAGEVAYLLTNGQGKLRARPDGTGRPPAKWRLLFISTGEITLADKVAEDGPRRATAGQQLRVLDIPADCGDFGVFENLHDAESGDEFARQLQSAAGKFYGTAIRELIEQITKDVDGAANYVGSTRNNISGQLQMGDADAQVTRAAGRFALIGAAGELATRLNITGWHEGDAAAAADKCFAAWLDRRGFKGPGDLEAAIAQVRKFFELHGKSRFEPWAGDVNRVTVNRVGFRRHNADRGTEYFVLPEAFKSEVCAGFDPRTVAAELIRRKYVDPGSGGKSSKSETIPALGRKARVYHFLPSIICSSDDEAEESLQ